MIIGWVACHLSVYLRCLWLLVLGGSCLLYIFRRENSMVTVWGSGLLSICLSVTSIVANWRGSCLLSICLSETSMVTNWLEG
jgi:hypothetical protein